MNCPRCGRQLPGNAAFCLHCGQMISGAPRPAQPQFAGSAPAFMPSAQTISAEVRRRNTWLAIGVSTAILAILFLGLRAGGILNFNGKSPSVATLDARGSAPNSALLQAKGTAPAPTLGITHKTMPRDLHDWLEHLARIEKKKQALTNKQNQQVRELQTELGGASGMTSADDVNKMSDPDYNSFPTLDKATAMLNELQPDWVALKKEFDSVPPPEECKPIAEAYDTGLENIIEVFASTEKLVGGVNLTDQNNIRQKADDVKGVGLHHRRGIDGEFDHTDDLVQDICDKYETKKWFKIDAHGGSPGLLGF